MAGSDKKKGEMRSRSVYLPAELFDDVDEWAQARGLSRNAGFGELVVLGLYEVDGLLEQQRQDILEARVAFQRRRGLGMASRPLPTGNDAVLRAYQESLRREEQEEEECQT